MGEDTTGMVTSVSKIREEFKALSGVDIMRDENTFKSTTQIVLELADAWEHMTDIQRAALGELAGGKRGAQSLFAAVQNADIIRKTIADANGAANGSVERQMAVWESSIDASLQRFSVAFQELSTDLINSNTIKGVVDFGTTIIKVIDTLVEHIGVLGTALTALGIAKVFSTAVTGAKSVTGWGNVLSTVFDELALSATNATEQMTAMQIVLTALKGKATGAGSALGTMFSGLGGFLLNPATIIAGTVAAAAAFGLHQYNEYKKQQEELTKQASEASKSWGENKTQIEDYKETYTKLNEQLSQSNLSEQERIGIKRQLLDLQNEIVAKYGDQVSGIDLVNGGLRTQLDLIGQISEKEARRNIRDNSEAYQQSVDEMTKQRTFSVRSGALFGGMYQRSLSPELQESFDKIYADAKFIKDGEMFKFTGNTSEFDKAVNDVLDGLEVLKESASEADAEILQTAIDSATKASKKNAETLNKYQDNYKSYLQQSLYADGFGDELAEYAKRTQEYNEALLTGDFEKINAAKQELDAYKVTVQEITDAHSEYGDFFDEVANSVDKTTEKFYQFKDIIQDGVAQSTNDLGKYQDQISAAAKKIKSLGLDSVDVENILLNGGVGYGDLSELAKLYNTDFDFSNEAVSAFADLLAQLGLVAGDTSEGMDLAKSSFEDFLKVASASIETVEKTNAALINSFGNKGLSMGIDAETGAITGDVATILNAYKDLKGFDAKVLFERTADGINVNTEALRALQSEQENTVKAEFMRRIIEAQNEISKAGTAEGKKYWEDQLETVRLLSTAYDGATSAYQKWIDAQKMTSPGSKYDTIVNSALKQGKEYYDKGLVGNPAFQAIAQLFTNEDLSLASTEEITKAYEDGVDTVKKYFTEGQEGAVAFADKLADLKLATKEWNDEKGAYDYDFSESGINTTQLADELGISVDLVEAAFGKLQEYGFEINFINDDQLTRLTELDEKASSARDRLAELADEEGRIGNTDVSSVIDIDITGLDTVDECNEAIEKISEAKANAEVDSDEYQYLDTLLQDIIMMRSVLEEGTKPSVDDSELVSVQETYDSLVDRILLLNHMNAAPGVHFDIDNDEEVRELAETLISMDDEEYKAKLGIDGIDTVDGIIEKLKQEHITVPVTTDTSGAQVNTSGTVDYSTGSVEAVGAQTAVLNYTTGTIEPIQPQTTTINYTTGKIEQVPDQSASINYSNGTIEQVPDQYATINYSANVTGLSALPDDGERRTIYLDTYTVQHYKGTVSRSAFQSLSSAGKVTGGSSHANGTLGKVGLKNDESALINELGAEIVVRPSDDSWMIFNDGKPTFANLKRGDVIFNADLTRQLLEKGEADDYARILSGNSHASGTLKGKAHATVKGGGSFKKATSSSSKSSGGGGGGDGGGSSGSKEDAKEFNEVLDEIQINIDRIERDIKNLDTIASDTFTNLTGRTSALNKELAKVRKEIKVQQTGYSRYLAKANSVGLNGTWAARVRAGENLTIDDVKDEDLWDKIQEYQKWWNSRHLIHLTAGKLRRHINYNARMKYA